MLAAKLFGKEDLRIVEVPVPTIGDGEILLRVKVGTVCGTDLRMYRNGADGVDDDHPLTLCHEFAGIVEDTGSGVTHIGRGERVSVAPNIGCGMCDRCVSAKSHHCKEFKAIGIHMDGGFAEFVRIPREAVNNGNVTPIPDNVSFAAAATNEAFSCVYSAYERYGVDPGDTVVIIGAGAIGLMHAKLALMSGAAKVIMSDLSQPRLDECAAIEPRVITVAEKLPEFVSDATGGYGADVVITACSVAAVQRGAFALAGLDGRICFFGGLPKGQELVQLDTNEIHYKQLSVTGITRSSHAHYRRTLDLIAKGLVDIDPIVTHSFEIKDATRAFDNASGAVGLKQAVVFE
ncbi:MAG: alcohol dehydrogenase catalytic domain-containing protein [Synergistaceae bacterium]|nr:alcohol dehydrogenase catalytic domain-containing protein [Synergistaceae bacterium]